MTKAEIVLEYLNSVKEYSQLGLAKQIHKDHPDKFKTVENARWIIRYCEASAGNGNRHKGKKPKQLTHDTRNKKLFKEVVNTSAKVLVFDIETAPISAYVWGIWNQNINTDFIRSDWFCLTWAAKWLFEDKVYSGKLTPKEVKRQDDKRIMRGIWELLNEADIVIAHNGEKFDIPKLNSRFIIHGFHPPLPYQVIDTLRHIRRQFGFTSNKLDYVNKLLNLPRKSDTGGFELWQRCMNGDAQAFDEMEAYNVQDVRILEETYLNIRPWIKPHPNMGLYILDQNERCPSCGSHDLQDCGKHYHTNASVFEVYRCNNCGSTGRRRTNKMTITEKRHSLLSIAK